MKKVYSQSNFLCTSFLSSHTPGNDHRVSGSTWQFIYWNVVENCCHTFVTFCCIISRSLKNSPLRTAFLRLILVNKRRKISWWNAPVTVCPFMWQIPDEWSLEWKYVWFRSIMSFPQWCTSRSYVLVCEFLTKKWGGVHSSRTYILFARLRFFPLLAVFKTLNSSKESFL